MFARPNENIGKGEPFPAGIGLPDKRLRVLACVFVGGWGIGLISKLLGDVCRAPESWDEAWGLADW